MNVLSLVLSLCAFLAIIFTLNDWTPKHGIATLISRTLISGFKLLVISAVVLYILLILNKGI
ncbi:hypothetical protein pETSU_158 [Edwardsiella phage pEt-SU]|uniref:Uncharacterized protein n=1 Tax=Edwardsiella phage pEt-SU TaxID=2562142 RepID=A0A4D6DYJ5_9CAUD|nr:hypothetical protein HOV39_gp158 [Edwardsiella phage pEt-SU]QBZ70739.1 hypothetical protein pETSU_158 [Edwardsiella phage pEt-SU]